MILSIFGISLFASIGLAQVEPKENARFGSDTQKIFYELGVFGNQSVPSLPGSRQAEAKNGAFAWRVGASSWQIKSGEELVAHSKARTDKFLAAGNAFRALSREELTYVLGVGYTIYKADLGAIFGGEMAQMEGYRHMSERALLPLVGYLKATEETLQGLKGAVAGQPDLVRLVDQALEQNKATLQRASLTPHQAFITDLKRIVERIVLDAQMQTPASLLATPKGAETRFAKFDAEVPEAFFARSIENIKIGTQNIASEIRTCRHYVEFHEGDAIRWQELAAAEQGERKGQYEERARAESQEAAKYKQRISDLVNYRVVPSREAGDKLVAALSQNLVALRKSIEALGPVKDALPNLEAPSRVKNPPGTYDRLIGTLGAAELWLATYNQAFEIDYAIAKDVVTPAGR